MKLRDGQSLVAGKTYKFKGKLKMCVKGYHASENILDALSYAPGLQVSRVECSGKMETQSDKLVCRNRKVLWTVDAKKIILAWSMRVATDAVKTAKKVCNDPAWNAWAYLWISGKDRTSASADAAYAAADAAYAAAADAAYAAADAAYAAADAAAYASADAAYAAADAAYAAARAAARAATDAAYAAARSAAHAADAAAYASADAAYAAARAAAYATDAAYAAARAAARDAADAAKKKYAGWLVASIEKASVA
jgi:hypothetical protein